MRMRKQKRYFVKLMTGRWKLDICLLRLRVTSPVLPKYWSTGVQAHVGTQTCMHARMHRHTHTHTHARSELVGEQGHDTWSWSFPSSRPHFCILEPTWLSPAVILLLRGCCPTSGHRSRDLLSFPCWACLLRS